MTVVRRFSLPAAALACGLVIGAVSWDAFDSLRTQPCHARYALINADGVCTGSQIIRKTSYVATQRDILAAIAGAEATKRVSRVSVYFRDLDDGPVFGINELEPFAPASLLKIPTAMVFMDADENESGVLDAKLRVEGTTTAALQRIAPQESAEIGATYSIRDLLRMMLSYSDNASYQVLDTFLAKTDERKSLKMQVFQELGFLDPQSRTERTLTVRGYAALFTLLYNASYLNPDDSQQVLTWLSDSTYRDGLVAGVPTGIVVAHKFGERLLDDGTKELHDCGIVYFPGNPYLICVMTRGNDWDALTQLISGVSRTVYQEVDSRRL